MRYLEKLFWKLAIYLIKRDYGCTCLDYEPRCPECEAQNMIDWINKHLDII